MTPTPQFAHDCSHCVYTGSSATHDFYVHGSGTATVVVTRFGEDEGDYHAMPLEHARMMEQPDPTATCVQDYSPLYLAVMLADLHMAGVM
jgi:hypothetical protein